MNLKNVFEGFMRDIDQVSDLNSFTIKGKPARKECLDLGLDSTGVCEKTSKVAGYSILITGRRG